VDKAAARIGGASARAQVRSGTDAHGGLNLRIDRLSRESAPPTVGSGRRGDCRAGRVRGRDLPPLCSPWAKAQTFKVTLTNTCRMSYPPSGIRVSPDGADGRAVSPRRRRPDSPGGVAMSVNRPDGSVRVRHSARLTWPLAGFGASGRAEPLTRPNGLGSMRSTWGRRIPASPRPERDQSSGPLPTRRCSGSAGH
jgi:hypothetical protein